MNKNKALTDLRPRYVIPEILAAVSLALILLSPLFVTPRPQAIANQPWRVELLIGIFAVPFVFWAYLKAKNKCVTLGGIDLRVALGCLLLFILWSGASAFWAILPMTTLFQTLVWAMYAVLFVAFLLSARVGSGNKVVFATLSIVGGILGLLTILDFLSIQEFWMSQGTIRVRYAKFAEMALTFAPLIAAISIYCRQKVATFATIVVWMLTWLAVMLSLSKGAFLAGIVAHLMLFGGSLLFSNRAFRQKVLVRAAIWLVLTIVVQVGFSIFTSIPSTADYISGKADKTRDTSTFRVFAWQVGMKMAADHWFLGVGSGNFGVAFNDSRAAFAATQPDARTPEYGQDYMFERAHNEALQIFAELGIVGIVLFAGIFFSFIFLAVKVFIRKRFKLSPMFWAAFAGMSGFFVSSMVSSFSFRAVQNGVVFVMVAAVAVYELAKNRPATGNLVNSAKIVLIPGLSVAVVLTLFAAPKAFAEYYLYKAERTEKYESSAALFRTALSLDPDNASAYYYFASRSNFEGDNESAAKMLRTGIDKGIGVTLTYSQLAKFQLLAGDTAAAEQTLAKGVRIFPNSVFMRVRYATFLSDMRKQAEADREMEYARSVDARHASGWEILIRKGSTAAFYAAQQDQNIAPPAELVPENVVLGYLDKIPGN